MLSFFKERLTGDRSRPSSALKTAPLTGYKLCNIDRTRKYGVAVNSLRTLREKASNKFSIEHPRIYVAKDGTEVSDEDYFETLDAQTLFVVASSNDHVQTDFELMYQSIRSKYNIIDTGKIIQGFLQENRSHINKWLEQTIQAKHDDEQRVLSSFRNEHPEWFLGQPDAIDSKEKLMKRRSQDRIRGYLYKTKDDLTKSALYKTNKHARACINTMLTIFQHLLQHVDYFSTYFNRQCPNRHPSTTPPVDSTDGESPKKRMRQQIQLICEQDDQLDRLCVALCNERGDFRCQGLWNQDTCDYSDHSINPYASRENAILFQIWNLDHRVEISRTIIPAILKSVEDFVTDTSRKCSVHNRKGRMVSVVQYFLEIFTVDNLKLVHIVCHDKGGHEMQSSGGVLCDRCEEYSFLKKLVKVVEDCG